MATRLSASTGTPQSKLCRAHVVYQRVLLTVYGTSDLPVVLSLGMFASRHSHQAIDRFLRVDTSHGRLLERRAPLPTADSARVGKLLNPHRTPHAFPRHLLWSNPLTFNPIRALLRNGHRTTFLESIVCALFLVQRMGCPFHFPSSCIFNNFPTLLFTRLQRYLLSAHPISSPSYFAYKSGYHLRVAP